jgi:N6-adenosine-specific RNA methylase IME4
MRPRRKGRFSYYDDVSSDISVGDSDDDQSWQPLAKPKAMKDSGVAAGLHESWYKENDSKLHSNCPLHAMAQGMAISRRISSDSPAAQVDPTGKPCPFVFLEDVKHCSLDPDSYFPSRCDGLNVLMPEYDPMGVDLLQFFGLDSQKVTFEMEDIFNMSDEDIECEIREIDEKLAESQNPVARSVVVCPFSGAFSPASIQCDVRTFDWADLGSRIQFDVILMDPPWKLQDHNPIRGLQLTYEMLEFEVIKQMPVNLLQTDGLLFLWVVTSVYHSSIRMMAQWGYEIVDTITWMKVSTNGFYIPSHGFFLQHCKEVVLVGRKGKGYDGLVPENFRDLIHKWRNPRQSHKPNELYSLIEGLCPHARYLEVFARSHNLRDRWVQI